MRIKLNLNKFSKFNSIENYTLRSIYEMMEVYDKYLKDSKGVDADYPEFKFNSSDDL
jgi:hypothetical protein